MDDNQYRHTEKVFFVGFFTKLLHNKHKVSYNIPYYVFVCALKLFA